MLFVGPGRIHTFDMTANYNGPMLLFTDAFFARSAADAQFLHTTILFQNLPDVPVVLAGAADSTLATLFTQLATELSPTSDPYQPVILQDLLHNLLLLAGRARRQQGYRPPRAGS